MITFLQGKKTYILMAVAVLYAVFGVILGYLDTKTALEVIYAALTGGAFRAAISKSSSGQ